MLCNASPLFKYGIHIPSLDLASCLMTALSVVYVCGVCISGSVVLQLMIMMVNPVVLC